VQGELDIWLYLRNNRRGECHDDCSDYELEHWYAVSRFDGRFRFLVALAAVRDLFICAKHLFAAARTVQRGQGGHHGAKAIGSAWA